MTPDRLADVRPRAPLMHTFFACHRQILATLRAPLAGWGLQREEFDVLANLGTSGAKTCKAIAQRLIVPNPTLTRTLARMTEKGLVKTEKGPTDAREKIVSLTPEGQATFENTFYPHLQLVQRCVDTLTPDEQAELDRLLHKLAAGFAAETPTHD